MPKRCIGVETISKGIINRPETFPAKKDLRSFALMFGYQNVEQVDENGKTILVHLFTSFPFCTLSQAVALTAFTRGEDKMPGNYSLAMAREITGPKPHGWTAMHCLLSSSDSAMELYGLVMRMLDYGDVPIHLFDELEDYEVIDFCFLEMRCPPTYVCTSVHKNAYTNVHAEVCTCVHMWAPVCTSVYVFKSAHVCTHVHMCAQVCVQVCICVHTCACTLRHICAHLCTSMHKNACTSVHTCACTLVHTYLCTLVHMCAHMCTSVHKSACTSVHKCAHVWTSVCTQVFKYAQECMHKCAHLCMHSCAYILVHTCSHLSKHGHVHKCA